MRILLLAALLTLTIAPSAAAQALREVELYLTYVPNVQFAPVYVALEKGYFADEGLDLRIRHGAEHDGVDLVAANQLQVGIFGGEQVLLARAQGRPVVSVYEWFQQFPAGVVAALGEGRWGYESFADLAGQRVGIHGRSGVTWTGLVTLMSAAGMTEQDFALETVGYNVPELICLGHIDAAVIYLNNEPLQLWNRIRADDCGEVQGIVTFPVSAVADLVSNVIVTNEETLASAPGLVEALVRAFDRGLRDAIANPAAVMLLSAPYVEGLVSEKDLPYLQVWSAARDEALAGEEQPDIMALNLRERMMLADPWGQADLTQYRVLLETVHMWQAEVLGYSERASWAATAEALLAAGMLEGAVDVDAAFTNRFVPGCAAGDVCPPS